MTGKKFTSTVAGASILITAVGLIGKGLGLIREIVFANFFGLNTQFDLYLVGAVLPITINTIILYLGQNYFIPNYNKTKIETPEKIRAFTNSTFWIFSLFGLLLAAILFSLSEPIVNLYLHNTSPIDFRSTLNVFRIFLFTIPLSAAYSILAAFLQSEFEFKSPAMSQLMLNVSIILLVVVFSNKIGVYTIPIGYVAGNLIQLIFLLIKSANKIRLSLFSFIKEKNARAIANYSLIITILIESISQIYLLADRYFFDEVQKGGIASLNYAMNLYLLPITIISVALSTAIFPSFSLSLNSNILEDVQRKLDNFFCVNLFLFIPISLTLISYGDIIIRILFQRGEFDSGATEMTFQVLKYYAVSLIFYSSYAVINKLLYGANLIKILLVITLTGCFIKIAANFYLVRDLQQNGLAISTSISYLFFFIAGIGVVLIKLKLRVKYFLKEFSIDIINGFVSYLLAVVLIPESLFPNSFVNGFLKLLIFCASYIFNAKLIKHDVFKLFENAFVNIPLFKNNRI